MVGLLFCFLDASCLTAAALLSDIHVCFSIKVADRFSIDRLKRACEHEMLDAISIESAATILLAAHEHSADILRERSMHFILQNFDDVSRTASFQDMGRTNIDLGNFTSCYVTVCCCSLPPFLSILTRNSCAICSA